MWLRRNIMATQCPSCSNNFNSIDSQFRKIFSVSEQNQERENVYMIYDMYHTYELQIKNRTESDLCSSEAT